MLADTYNRQRIVTVQLKTVEPKPDITTLIQGYNANDIVVNSDRFIPLQGIRNVALKKTDKL